MLPDASSLHLGRQDLGALLIQVRCDETLLRPKRRVRHRGQGPRAVVGPDQACDEEGDRGVECFAGLVEEPLAHAVDTNLETLNVAAATGGAAGPSSLKSHAPIFP